MNEGMYETASVYDSCPKGNFSFRNVRFISHLLDESRTSKVKTLASAISPYTVSNRLISHELPVTTTTRKRHFMVEQLKVIFVQFYL